MYHAINPEPNLQKSIERPQRRLRYWLLLGLSILCFTLPQYYQIAINQTSSLPQKYWLIALGKTPKRHDYVCFKPSAEMLAAEKLSHNVTLTKQVIGVPNDAITRKGRDFYINGHYKASAKTHSLKNEPLEPGPTGVLPPEHYFVFSPHLSSFDSRYARMGWIKRAQIIGVAYALW